MKLEKRKRLEQAGWKVGSTQEFLGLSDEEMAVIELKLVLRDQFRERRRRLRLSQQAVAKRLGSSQSRVAKMEAGDPSVSLDLLIRALLALGETPRSLGRVIARAA
jgi:DNA-binding XRE family transcriptional regulator